MGKYADDATKLLELVGGKDNIAAVSHCMTRMRFVLNDESKADVPVSRRFHLPRAALHRLGSSRSLSATM